MDSTSKKSFSPAESNRLVELVIENLPIIKGTDKRASAASRREEKWSEIAAALNSANVEGATHRTVLDCKKHWQYKQGAAKKSNAEKKRYETIYYCLIDLHFTA